VEVTGGVPVASMGSRTSTVQHRKKNSDRF